MTDTTLCARHWRWIVYGGWVTIEKHRGLKQGLMLHKKCDNCVETRPALKIHLDEDDPLVAIERHIRCSEHVWDFSIGLIAWHKTTKSMENVVRACSAHANYHLHQWEYMLPRKKLVPLSLAVLDNEDLANLAYSDASARIVTEAFDWRESWRPKKR